MSKLGQFFTDDYERETLLAPAMAVTLTPIVVAALLGFNVDTVLGFAVLGIEAATIVLWLLANTIRDAGRTLEKRLFSGTFPTTRSLRLLENSGYETNARRELLERLSGVTLLTKRQERGNPGEADQRIKHAVDVAKEKMRDPKKFKLLRREVKSYGFWRNMAAIRWWGFGVATGSALAAMALLLTTDAGSKTLPGIALGVGAVGAVYWLAVVRDGRVVAAAERYKEQYFKSLALL